MSPSLQARAVRSAACDLQLGALHLGARPGPSPSSRQDSQQHGLTGKAGSPGPGGRQLWPHGPSQNSGPGSSGWAQSCHIKAPPATTMIQERLPRNGLRAGGTARPLRLSRGTRNPPATSQVVTQVTFSRDMLRSPRITTPPGLELAFQQAALPKIHLLVILPNWVIAEGKPCPLSSVLAVAVTAARELAGLVLKLFLSPFWTFPQPVYRGSSAEQWTSKWDCRARRVVTSSNFLGMSVTAVCVHLSPSGAVCHEPSEIRMLPGPLPSCLPHPHPSHQTGTSRT